VLPRIEPVILVTPAFTIASASRAMRDLVIVGSPRPISHRPPWTTPPSFTDAASAVVTMLRFAGSRSSRAIDSRSFSFDAGTCATVSACS
jgi:hypothetical protein